MKCRILAQLVALGAVALVAAACSTTSSSPDEDAGDSAATEEVGGGDTAGTDEDTAGPAEDAAAPAGDGGQPAEDVPVADDVPLDEDTSAPADVPIVEDTPAPADTPVSDDTAASEDAPSMEDTQAAEDVPANEDVANPISPSQPGVVQLSDPLDEPEFYCLDVPGFGANVQLDSPLNAHTCKGDNADDQVFVANDPGPGQLRMPAYDLCLESDGVYSTATISLKPCATTAMQLWRLRDDDRIELAALYGTLCIAVADGAGAPAGGPSHLIRDLDLQDCDTVPTARSQWTVPGGVLEPPDLEVACADLTNEIDGLLESTASCSAAADCTLYEYPICGSAGCYQRATGSLESVPESVWELATDASLLGCEPFHCGCGYDAFPACIEGACQLCPGPGCELSCDDLIALLVEQVGLNSSCDNAAQCTGLPTSLCTVPELGCYQAAVNFSGSWGLIPKLIDMIGEQNCALADCDCTDQSVDCVNGACASVP